MRRALLAGIACAALAGFSGPALAKSPEFHVLTVQLPGGGVEHISYTGDVPPMIVIAPIAAPGGAAFTPMPAFFGPNSPFAMMDRISAEMNREAASLMRQVESLAAPPMPGAGALTEAAFGQFPPGASGYSLVSTMTGNGVCTESMQITYSGNGAPKVVSSRSGDCGPATGGAAPAAVHVAPAPARKLPPGTILASTASAQPYAPLVRKADWQQ
ncbi:MAG TPA: hypothetical protein VMF62_08975 [Acetobacteraceae bacterium]|jgi:hypothetical protein|nr:hypothetical protein [Acetobacteraceae bacterium]